VAKIEVDLTKCLIRGQNHYKGNVSSLFDSHTAGFAQELDIDGILEPEPHNKHDPNAVVLKIRGYSVGYIAQEHAVDVKNHIGSGVRVTCKLLWNRDPETPIISVLVTSID
jgi:hypothetical protein